MSEIKRVVSSYTKAIIVNSPNNPSGAMYPEEFLAELVDFCETKGIYLIMDDIYHKLVYGKQEWQPAWNFTNRDIENTHVIVVNGVSKLYGMTGFRIGWVVAPRKLVLTMINVQAQMTSNPSSISQAERESRMIRSSSTTKMWPFFFTSAIFFPLPLPMSHPQWGGLLLAN